MNDNREHLIYECRRIEDDAKYTAEVHFRIANDTKWKIFWVKLIPALLSATSGIGIILLEYTWLGWLAVISSAVFAVQTVIDFDRECTDHTNAGKHYTTLKHEARSLHETFHHELDKGTYAAIVSILRERYNNISFMTPKTTDKAFEKASKKIQSGKHEPDFNTGS